MGTGVVAHAGSAGLRLLADRTGLTGEVSKALARRGFIPGHDRGQMLLDVAVMVVAGGEAALSCSAATACAAPVPWAATPAFTPALWVVGTGSVLLLIDLLRGY